MSESKDILDQSEQWVTFNLDTERYCVPVSQVKEIISWQDVEPVPGAPDIVEGIINLRGDIITVVNGRTLLKLPSKEADDETRIMTLEVEQESIGLVIDQVHEIVRFNADNIDPPAMENPLLFGTIKLNEHLLIVLKINEERLGEIIKQHDEEANREDAP